MQFMYYESILSTLENFPLREEFDTKRIGEGRERRKEERRRGKGTFQKTQSRGRTSIIQPCISGPTIPGTSRRVGFPTLEAPLHSKLVPSPIFGGVSQYFCLNFRSGNLVSG